MLIRCWGARGSVPVSGPEYLRYGGCTACLEVRSRDGRVILVDAGTGIRKLGIRLLSEEPGEVGLLFTHAHWDHILGFPFFRPLYRNGVSIEIFGYPFAQRSVRDMIELTMSPPYFPVRVEDVKARLGYHDDWSQPFGTGDVLVTPIALSHPGGGLGYRFAEGDRTFVLLTDNELGLQHPGGHSFEQYVAFCEGADFLIHDAEYTAEEYESVRGWGHSTYPEAVRLAREAGVGRLGLFHHNQDRTDEALDEIARQCQALAGADGPECFAVAQGMEIRL